MPLIPVLAAAVMTQAAVNPGGDVGVRTLVLQDPHGRDCYRYAARVEPVRRAFAACDAAVAAYEDGSRRRAAAHVNRGTLHYARGRFAEAAGDFAQGVRHGLDNAVVHANRGLAFEQLGRSEPSYDALARAAYERALALNPDHALAAERLGELAKPRRERSRLARIDTA